jgi:hypothetical protein
MRMVLAASFVCRMVRCYGLNLKAEYSALQIVCRLAPVAAVYFWRIAWSYTILFLAPRLVPCLPLR